MVFFITGLSGSGKTTAAGFFQRLGIPVVRMGDVTQRSLESKRLGRGEKQEETVRQALRARYGSAIYARRTLPYINRAAKTSRDVVVEGMRSRDELRYFEKTVGPVSLIYIQAETTIRRERLGKRPVRPLTADEIGMRDAWEQEIGVERLKTVANYVVENNGTKEELYGKLHVILRASS